MILDRAKLLEEAKEATLKANIAQERLTAWAMVVRSLLRLMFAYEGNSLHSTIKEWYDTIVQEKVNRHGPLSATLTKERERAAKLIDEHNETPAF